MSSCSFGVKLKIGIITVRTAAAAGEAGNAVRGVGGRGSALGCIFSARAGASDYWSRMIIMLGGLSHGTGSNAMGREDAHGSDKESTFGHPGAQ